MIYLLNSFYCLFLVGGLVLVHRAILIPPSGVVYICVVFGYILLRRTSSLDHEPV